MKFEKAITVIQKSIWVLLLVALPVTSFPLFPPAIGGEALVRPLALFPLIILVILVVIPKIIKKPIPRTVILLIPFVLIAIASSLLSLLRGIEPALGISASARVLRGIFTLGIGCAFYLVIALVPDSREDLRFTMRWIYIGMCLAMLWASIQALFLIIFPNPDIFPYLEKAQRLISIRRLNPTRVAGMTYEPHWFAEQVLLLVIPWALASVMTGFSVFHNRWRRVTAEWFLLGWAILLIPFTFSRSGFLSLTVIIILGVYFFGPRNSHIKSKVSISVPTIDQLISTAKRAMQFGIVIFGVLLPVYLIGSRNAFFSRLWEYWRNPNATIQGYISQIAFDARQVYGQAAYRTYLSYPILGVGLGNYAFYFEEMLPYKPIAEIPEVLLMITPEAGRDRLITAKNLYLRLMAETGIVGLIAFLAFLIGNLGCALYLWDSSDPEWRYWGTASFCGLIALILSAMTFDSFVIPNMWVIFGLITAATRVMLHSN